MNAPANLTSERYSVRSYGSRDMAMVYEDGKRYAGPCSWPDANKLADHRNASDRRSRQQNDAEPTPDDFPEYERSASQADREYQFRKEEAL